MTSPALASGDDFGFTPPSKAAKATSMAVPIAVQLARLPVDDPIATPKGNPQCHKDSGSGLTTSHEWMMALGADFIRFDSRLDPSFQLPGPILHAALSLIHIPGRGRHYLARGDSKPTVFSWRSQCRESVPSGAYRASTIAPVWQARYVRWWGW